MDTRHGHVCHTAFCDVCGQNPPVDCKTRYLNDYRDVKRASYSAVDHYCVWGRKEGRPTCLTPDLCTVDECKAAYLNINTDVNGAGYSSVDHYCVWGRKEGRPTCLTPDCAR